MSVEVKQWADSPVVEVYLSGKLTKEDYLHFVPILEQQIKVHKKLHLYVQMHDFAGWTAGALWQDVMFDFRHLRDIDRLAIVGESKWEQGMSIFCKPFTTAMVRYFDISKQAEAHAWVEE